MGITKITNRYRLQPPGFKANEVVITICKASILPLAKTIGDSISMAISSNYQLAPVPFKSLLSESREVSTFL